MTREEKELTITYLEKMKESYIEGEGYERHPLPEYYAIESAIKLLEQESKTAKWVLLDECANSGYYCSECHKKLVKEGWSDTVKKIKYCPNCGAKMRGNENE